MYWCSEELPPHLRSLWVINPAYGGSTLFRNVGKILLDDTTSFSRTQNYARCNSVNIPLNSVSNTGYGLLPYEDINKSSVTEPQPCMDICGRYCSTKTHRMSFESRGFPDNYWDRMAWSLGAVYYSLLGSIISRFEPAIITPSNFRHSYRIRKILNRFRKPFDKNIARSVE
jgi:hypothetical protein